MKLKTSVAAVILAFSATGAWAGPTGTGNSQSDLGTPDTTAVQPSAAPVNEELQWKFVNGTSATDSEKRDSDQAAKPVDQGNSDQAAQSEEQGSSEQSAKTKGQPEGDQSSKSKEEDGSDQTAQSEEQDGNDQTANSVQPAADLKDKVVVIIPKDWKGSLFALIAALESSPDAKDIVIVQQGEPQASSDEPEDGYSASSKPVINQQ